MKSLFLAVVAIGLPLIAQAAEPPAPASTPPAASNPAPARAPAPAPAAAKALTVDSTVGELIDNPKTDAVLKRLIPDARNNENFPTIGRDLTLRAIAEFEPSITTEKLAALVQELAKAQAVEESRPAVTPPTSAPAREPPQSPPVASPANPAPQARQP